LINNFIQLTEAMIESQPVDKSLKWRIRLAKIYIIGNSIGLLLSLVLFAVGYLDWLWFSRQIMASIGGYLIAFIILKLPTGKVQYEPNRARKITGFFFVLGGEMFTSIFLFFVTGYLLMTILGSKILAGPIGDAFLIFSFCIGPIIGSIFGYAIFKKSKYSNLSLYSSF
jgi:hypothetical protein